jgi:hypothetical protein
MRRGHQKRRTKKRRGHTLHHKKCRSNGGSSDDGNLAVLRLETHAHWHAIFGNKTPEKICRIINAVFLDPSFHFICERRS